MFQIRFHLVNVVILMISEEYMQEDYVEDIRRGSYSNEFVETQSYSVGNLHTEQHDSSVSSNWRTSVHTKRHVDTASQV